MSTSFSLFQIDEISYFIKYFTDHIAEYKLSELTSGTCGDIPSINGAHPLALEFGNALHADQQGNYTSILPAIGIEFIDNSEDPRQVLGAGHQTVEITQTTINEISAIAPKDRIKNGVLMSTSSLNTIIAAKAAKGAEKLYASFDRYIHNQSINVSIWSRHIDVTRITFLVVQSLLKRAKRDLSGQGIKNLLITSQGSLYNYDFGETLFGLEFHLTLLSPFELYEVDAAIETIKHFEENLETGIPGNYPGNKMSGKKT